MNRLQILFSVLGLVLIVVLATLLVFQPREERLSELETRIDQELDLQAQLTRERNELRDVRGTAPELEAQLSTAEVVVPSHPDIPGLVRSVQLAADDAGALLVSISPSRMQQLPDAPEGVSAADLNIQLEGNYFQVVDFLRRVEDPDLIGRGILWTGASLTRDDAAETDDEAVIDDDVNAGTVMVTLSGRVYSHLPEPPSEEELEDPDAAAPDDDPQDPDGDDADDLDDDEAQGVDDLDDLDEEPSP